MIEIVSSKSSKEIGRVLRVLSRSSLSESQLVIRRESGGVRMSGRVLDLRIMFAGREKENE